ncbi:META domain-containing protein [Helicobacter cappadocius]|uniref:META domain-containing protein n=1 Tax=Helicobacter cappadocius TaxID=3063998 RepID=A0AA90PSR9_9HELI|nr:MULTISPECIES: META domain-containing protein [unclassified Helicobacter]MDO7253090.1 META domain-containing protein [Helicobacter sp. faydin-H75]MDP2538784.1 META domain-containing protein [Helicobacter sp. faydin-H76]
MRLFSLVLAGVFFTGCSLLNVFDGNIAQDNWKIQKIIVGGKEYLSPQSLKAETLKDAQNKTSESTQETDNTDNASSEKNTLLSDSDATSSDSIDNEASDIKQNNASNDEGEFTSLNEVSTMTFDPSQHRIYGLAACNNYFASYAWKDDDHIEIANSGITRKLCSPDELMSFEFRFMRDFSGLFTITRNKTSMILDNGKMQIYLQAIKP